MPTVKNENPETERLSKSFPADLREHVEAAISAMPMEREVILGDGSEYQFSNFIHALEYQVYLNGEALYIPKRIYFDEPESDKENTLTGIQKTILHCIYLRHHNGFVRQKRLEQLIHSTDVFVIPFTLQLLGEYVIEILAVLDKHITEKTIGQYSSFINENRKYWQQTQSRMVSYWAEYYRRTGHRNIKDYIGQKIVRKLTIANT